LKSSINQNFNQKPYASARLRALITIVLLALGAASSLLSMIVNAALAATLRGAGDLTAPYELGESASELLYVVVALLQLFIFTATVVAFLLWLHRAYGNLPALGAMALDTTPGWAAGYFFIPIVNLFKPFQVVKEIWHESTPGGETREGFGGVSVRSKTPALVGWWWAFWIIANVAGRASDRAVVMAETIESMVLASWVSIASEALFVVAAALAILVVKRIDEMQEAKFREMGAQGPPPPPESFETHRNV
jgi:hypothetical protein